jgi:hypothetical protein
MHVPHTPCAQEDCNPTSTSAPSRYTSCMAREPPRESGTRNTPMR